MDLQFRAEFFNLFNIVNMGLPANRSGGRRLWRNQPYCGHFAADSVFSQADLLTWQSK